MNLRSLFLGSARIKVGATIFILFGSMSVYSQDAMFVDSTGNVGVGTNFPDAALHVNRTDNSAEVRVVDTGADSVQTMFNLINKGHPKFRLQDTSQSDVRWEFRTAGTQGSSERFAIDKIGNSVAEMSLDHQGNVTFGGTVSGGSSWSVKDEIAALDSETVLRKVARLGIHEWSYEGSLSERHAGPMAEDFYTVFGLGPDDKHIAASDMAGVALAAIKGLKAENDKLRARLSKMESLQGDIEELRLITERLMEDRSD